MALKPTLRWALAAAVVLVFLLLLVLSLVLTDLLLRVWERLAQTPPWVFYTWLAVFLALVGAGVWLIVRLLRPPRQALAPTASPLTESELDERLQQAAERGRHVRSWPSWAGGARRGRCTLRCSARSAWARAA
ncbi:MAG: hypothetical protein P8015_06145 [Acidihalobacter sp.]